MTYDVRVEYIVLPLGSDDEVISGFFKVDKLIDASNEKIVKLLAKSKLKSLPYNHTDHPPPHPPTYP